MLKRRVENSLSRLKVRFRGTPNGEASTKASSAAQNATSINANTLCAFCSSLFTTNHPILKTVDDVLSFDISEIHQSPTDFQQAVGQKCPLCMLRWNQLSDEEQTQVREVVKRIDLSISVDLKDNNIGIMYGYRLEDGGRRARTIIKNVDLVPDEEIGTNANRYEIFGSTASKGTMAIIKWWLQRCEAEHMACNGNFYLRGTRKFPTRLLDLGDGTIPKPRLCKRSGLPARSEYVSLSHCWGTFEPLKLTTQNMDELEVAIPFEKLPKTFRDAITVTWQLGFRYLWIDSLCIIQDSKEDWQKEAMTMKNVYQRATLNIAATNSVDGQGGLFFERDPATLGPHTVDVTWDGLISGKYHMCDRYLWKNEVIEAPLSKRGWVLQERLLSTRKVHFGKNQVFWECQSDHSCEAYPGFVPWPMLRALGVYLDLNMFHDGVVFTGGHGGEDGLSGLKDFRLSVYKIWDRVVQTYSSLAFTKTTDRLIALAGVAQVLGSMNDSEYLAGLWSKRLPRALLWVVDDPETASRPDSYIAPSWSWVSINGKVTIPPDLPEENAESPVEAIIILDAKAVSLSKDSYGQIQSGYISLQGALMRVTIGTDTAILTLGKGNSGEAITAKTWADVGRFVQAQKLYCLPIYMQAGLCLELCGDKDGTFKRVGWWTTDHNEGPAAVLALCEEFEADGAIEESGQADNAPENVKGLARWKICLV